MSAQTKEEIAAELTATLAAEIEREMEAQTAGRGFDEAMMSRIAEGNASEINHRAFAMSKGASFPQPLNAARVVKSSIRWATSNI